MKLKLITLLGVTALMSACTHHDQPMHKNCDHYMGVKGAPTPPTTYKNGTLVDCHEDHAARRYGIFGSDPYKAARPAPSATRMQTAPETVQRDNYPFWR